MGSDSTMISTLAVYCRKKIMHWHPSDASTAILVNSSFPSAVDQHNHSAVTLRINSVNWSKRKIFTYSLSSPLLFTGFCCFVCLFVCFKFSWIIFLCTADRRIAVPVRTDVSREPTQTQNLRPTYCYIPSLTLLFTWLVLFIDSGGTLVSYLFLPPEPIKKIKGVGGSIVDVSKRNYLKSPSTLLLFLY